MRYVGRFMRYVLCDIQGRVHEVCGGFMRYVLYEIQARVHEVCGGFMRVYEVCAV